MVQFDFLISGHILSYVTGIDFLETRQMFAGLGLGRCSMPHSSLVLVHIGVGAVPHCRVMSWVAKSLSRLSHIKDR